jgi:hypothetical protein
MLARLHFQFTRDFLVWGLTIFGAVWIVAHYLANILALTRGVGVRLVERQIFESTPNFWS